MKGNIYPRSHRLQSVVHLLIVLMLDCVGARCTSFKCHFIIELYKKIIIKLLIIIITRACIMMQGMENNDTTFYVLLFYRIARFAR